MSLGLPEEVQNKTGGVQRQGADDEKRRRPLKALRQDWPRRVHNSSHGKCGTENEPGQDSSAESLLEGEQFLWGSKSKKEKDIENKHRIKCPPRHLLDLEGAGREKTPIILQCI
jgi:hypothetical protein